MNKTEGNKRLKFSSWVASFAVIAVLSAMGCAAGMVDRTVLTSVKKVGILSISINKLGAQSTDDEVMLSVINYAAPQYTDVLAKRPEWKLVPLNYKDNALIRDFLKQPSASNKQRSGNAAAGAAVETVAPDQIKHYLAAQNMPVIPCNMIWPPFVDDSTVTTKSESAPNLPEYRNQLLPKIGELAAKLNLDGLMVVFLQIGVRPTVKVDVNVADRGNDTLRMEPAMILVTRDGKVAIDTGEPSINPLSPGRAGVPLYRLEYAKTIQFGSKGPNRTIDLKDPKGKVQTDLLALSDTAFSKFTKKLNEQLSQK
jgi:hypothetical protein